MVPRPKSPPVHAGGPFTIRYFLAGLRLVGVSGVRCFPRSQTEAGNNVSYRNPKERIHARPLYYGDNERSQPPKKRHFQKVSDLACPNAPITTRHATIGVSRILKPRAVCGATMCALALGIAG